MDQMDHGFVIAVLDRGWVFIGNVTTDEEWCVIEKAKNIRIWGTKKGLGELAACGPQPSTVMDDAGSVRVSRKALLFTIAVDKSKWPCGCKCGSCGCKP